MGEAAPDVMGLTRRPAPRDHEPVSTLAARLPRSQSAELEGFQEILRTIAFAGSEPILEPVLDLARDFLEAERALAYRLDCRSSTLDVDYAHCRGILPVGELIRRARSFLGTVKEVPTCYQLPVPLPQERNTLFNSDWPEHREIYSSSPFVRDFFPSLGIPAVETLRVLFTDGPHILSWFGLYRSDPFGRREEKRLQMLIEPLQKRLQLEDRLQRLTLKAAALDAAMDALRVPALIVDPKGGVAHANEAARLLSPDERAVLVARAQSQGETLDGEVGRLAIRARGLPPHAFVVQREGLSLKERLALFAKHWKLTRRQVQVMEQILEGRANKEIATALGIEAKTVEFHVAALLRKVKVESRAELVAAFWKAQRV